METFSNRLKRLRIAKNLSVAKIAELLGISSSTYREWEYGRAIKGEPYAKIAEILEVGVTELITGMRADKIKIMEKIDEIEKQLKLLKRELDLIF